MNDPCSTTGLNSSQACMYDKRYLDVARLFCTALDASDVPMTTTVVDRHMTYHTLILEITKTLDISRLFWSGDAKLLAESIVDMARCAGQYFKIVSDGPGASSTSKVELTQEKVDEFLNEYKRNRGDVDFKLIRTLATEQLTRSIIHYPHFLVPVTHRLVVKQLDAYNTGFSRDYSTALWDSISELFFRVLRRDYRITDRPGLIVVAVVTMMVQQHRNGWETNGPWVTPQGYLSGNTLVSCWQERHRVRLIEPEVV